MNGSTLSLDRAAGLTLAQAARLPLWADALAAWDVEAADARPWTLASARRLPVEAAAVTTPHHAATAGLFQLAAAAETGK